MKPLVACVFLVMGAGCTTPAPAAAPEVAKVDAVFSVDAFFAARRGQVECTANGYLTDAHRGEPVWTLNLRSGSGTQSVECEASILRPCLDSEQDVCAAMGVTRIRQQTDAWGFNVTRPSGRPACPPTPACAVHFTIDASGQQGGTASKPTASFQAIPTRNNFGSMYVTVARFQQGETSTTIWGGFEFPSTGTHEFRLDSGVDGQVYDYEARWWFQKSDEGHEAPRGRDRLANVSFPAEVEISVTTSGKLDIYQPTA